MEYITKEEALSHKRESLLTTKLAVLLAIMGCLLLIAAFIVDPQGEIHPSVLVAFAEIMTFVAALLGINARFKSVINDIISRRSEAPK